MAMPAKLLGISSGVAYNLAMVTIPALVAVGCLGLTYNLVRIAGGGFRAGVVTGLVACLLVGFLGNLIGALEFAQLRGWGSEAFWQWVSIKNMEGAATGGFTPTITGGGGAAPG